MQNIDIRFAAKKAGVALWQIAEEFGISEPTIGRRLRHELPECEKAKYFAVIDALSKKMRED